MKTPISIEKRPLHLTPKDVFENAPIAINSLGNTIEGRAALLEHFSNLISEEPNQVMFIPSDTASDIGLACGRIYGALTDSLELLFGKHRDKIPFFFGLNEAQHGSFIDYAAYTYEKEHKAIYGRFDVIVDKAGLYPKVIEFNGDTPVMLFESIVMQNLFSERQYLPERQFNIYYELTCEALRLLELRGKKIGIVCNFGAIEDLLTSETFYHMMDYDGLDVSIGQLSQFLYEPIQINDNKSPFVLNSEPMDVVFMLHPWEEMIEASPEIISEWRSWCDLVRFLEPAWRLFVSNKGSMAWLHWLIEHEANSEWAQEYKEDVLKYLPRTVMMTPELKFKKPHYVKPVSGRLSSNIQLHTPTEAGVEIVANGGVYEGELFIAQEAVEHTPFDDTNLMPLIGVWMAPSLSLSELYNDSMCMEAGTISVRMSDWRLGANDHQEEYVPHIITGELN